MNITNDMAFDMLPHAVEIFEKLDLVNYVKKNKVIVKDKTQKDKISDEKALEFIMHIAKNAKKIKNQVFEIVAIANNKTADEVAKENFFNTIKTFKEILQSQDMLTFFQSAMK